MNKRRLQIKIKKSSKNYLKRYDILRYFQFINHFFIFQTNYQNDPFFKNMMDQVKKIAFLSKSVEPVEELVEKMGKLQDLVDIKDKHKTDITKCIETEIYPHIEI